MQAALRPAVEEAKAGVEVRVVSWVD